MKVDMLRQAKGLVGKGAAPGIVFILTREEYSASTKKGSQHTKKVRRTMPTVSVAFHSCRAYVPTPELNNKIPLAALFCIMAQIILTRYGGRGSFFC